MMPTSTGAAKAIGLALPRLKGKLDSIAVHVPTSNVSPVDLTATLEREVDEAAVNSAMKHAAWRELKGILEHCEEPLVLADFNENPYPPLSSMLRLPCSSGIERPKSVRETTTNEAMRAAWLMRRR
jgi:glyceraldehyde-3-phosphate dehydrogenase/erythrose-4-phosphate dehydrogenase